MNMVTNITIFFGNEKKMINIFCYLSANYLAFFIFLVRNYGNYGCIVHIFCASYIRTKYTPN